jgi:lipoate-protein ligase A
MALDEALLESHRQGLAPPALRLYAWARPTVSLGYAQRVEPDQLDTWHAAGADVVRRPTGGRAVVHAGDLTYSLVTSGLPPGVAASYRRIAAALGVGLARLGAPVSLAAGAAPPGRGPACFAAATQADMCLDGRKLVGSAQVRRHGAVLQHGSLYLARTPWLDMLPGQSALATLPEVLGRPVSAEEVGTALAAGLSEALDVELTPGAPTPWELAQAAAGAARWRTRPTTC